MTVAALGGSVGSLLGMYTVRHKTKHPKFTIGIPLLLAGRIDATLNAEVVFADYHTELQLKSLKKILIGVQYYNYPSKNAAARFPSRNVRRRCTIWDGRFYSHSCLRQTNAFQLPRGCGGGVLGGFHHADLSQRDGFRQFDPEYGMPQSSSDGKDAGTKPIPRFAFTMGSI